jgi:hypothetical protein
LTVAEVIQKFALRVVGIDFERQIERSARGNDTKLLIEHNERFSNRIDNSVRKCPSILDRGELLSKHVTTSQGGSLLNSQSPTHPTTAEDSQAYTHYVGQTTQFDVSRYPELALSGNIRCPVGSIASR